MHSKMNRIFVASLGALALACGSDDVSGEDIADPTSETDGSDSSSSETDSGTLAVVDVEGLGQGSGVVQVMNGRYMAGANPISGRVLGSLITVE